MPESKLRARDAVSLGTLGLRTRKGRTAMAAIGIAIGVASLIALVGILNSGKLTRSENCSSGASTCWN